MTQLLNYIEKTTERELEKLREKLERHEQKILVPLKQEIAALEKTYENKKKFLLDQGVKRQLSFTRREILFYLEKLRSEQLFALWKDLALQYFSQPMVIDQWIQQSLAMLPSGVVATIRAGKSLPLVQRQCKDPLVTCVEDVAWREVDGFSYESETMLIVARIDDVIMESYKEHEAEFSAIVFSNNNN